MNGNKHYFGSNEPPDGSWNPPPTATPSFYCHLSYYGEEVDKEYLHPYPDDPGVWGQGPMPHNNSATPDYREETWNYDHHHHRTIRFKEATRLHDKHKTKPYLKPYVQNTCVRNYQNPETANDSSEPNENPTTYKIETQITHEPPPLTIETTQQSSPVIVIDGSSVAFTHGDDLHFSCKGVQICVDYFKQKNVSALVVVPSDRLRRGASKDVRILYNLKRAGMLRQNWYGGFGNANTLDCDFVMKIAAQHNYAPIVSNSEYIRQRWERTLPFQFEGEKEKRIIFPESERLFEYFE